MFLFATLRKHTTTILFIDSQFVYFWCRHESVMEFLQCIPDYGYGTDICTKKWKNGLEMIRLNMVWFFCSFVVCFIFRMHSMFNILFTIIFIFRLIECMGNFTKKSMWCLYDWLTGISLAWKWSCKVAINDRAISNDKYTNTNQPLLLTTCISIQWWWLR